VGVIEFSTPKAFGARDQFGVADFQFLIANRRRERRAASASRKITRTSVGISGGVSGRASVATVREDYSENGDAWNYFPHDQARSRAFRWGEEASAAFATSNSGSVSHSRSGTARSVSKRTALWRDRPAGNHGRRLKEIYFYTDCTPTTATCRALSLSADPLSLRRIGGGQLRQPKEAPEPELWDTGSCAITATSISCSNTPRSIRTIFSFR